MLYKDLNIVLKKLLSYKNIGRIGIPTNGTVDIKDSELLKTLQNRRLYIDISDYGIGHVSALVETLKRNHIRYFYTREKYWYDLGGKEERKRSDADLDKQFRSCYLKCHSILNKRLYMCARSSHGSDLGFFPCGLDEHIDLSKPVNRDRLKEFYYRNKHIEACKYCDVNGEDRFKKPIPAGKEQIRVQDI